MTEGPVFIFARNYREATDVAEALDIPPTLWRFLNDDYALRGRSTIQVAYGPLYYEHPRAQYIEQMLTTIERRKPGSVVSVEVPS